MVTERLRFAVITTHDREDDFADCYLAIDEQVDRVVVVSHDAPYTDTLDVDPEVAVIHYNPPGGVPNISIMWNLGLDVAAGLADGRPYDVAVLNDDAIVPDGWFTAVTAAMRETGATAGSAMQYPYPVIDRPHLFTVAEPIDLRLRMSGFAYILNGDHGLWLDEDLRWWFSDDDLEWRAREQGGVVLVPGFPVEHRHPGSTTVGELARIAGEDRERFAAKWGRTPH